MTIEARIKIAIKCEMGNKKVFERLEEQSMIKASSWQAMLYGRQRATSEMITFICQTFPHCIYWIMTGNDVVLMPDQTNPAKSLAQSYGIDLQMVLSKPASALNKQELAILNIMK